MFKKKKKNPINEHLQGPPVAEKISYTQTNFPLRLKYYITPILIFCHLLVYAQDFPTPIVGHAFCKSGVENSAPGRGLVIEYFLHPRYNLQTDFLQDGTKTENEVDNKKFIEAKLKLPIINTDEFKMLIGFAHTYEKYDFDRIDPADNYLFRAINDVPLRRTRTSLIFFKSLSYKNYLAIRLGASYNGNYDGFVDFEKRYAIYRASAIYGFKKNPNKELAIGLTLNNSFNRTLVLPFVVWNRTYNKNWGVESVLPLKVNIRRNFKNNDLLLMGYEYWSSAYSMDITPNGQDFAEDFHFRSSALHLSVDYQKRLISDWTWIGIKTGWAWNFDSRFTRTTDDVQFDAFPSNSFFISLSFFVSPPESVRKALSK